MRLPIDIYTKRNLGYAFVNFSDSHEVLKLFCAVRIIIFIKLVMIIDEWKTMAKL